MGGEWGRKMHNDLVDAVKWAKRHGIAIPDKIAIVGGSYGGYATLAGLTFDSPIAHGKIKNVDYI